MSYVIIIANKTLYRLSWNEVIPDYTGIAEPLLSQLKSAFGNGNYVPFGEHRLDDRQFASGAVNGRVIGNNMPLIRGTCRWNADGSTVGLAGCCTKLTRTASGMYTLTTTTIPLTAAIAGSADPASVGANDSFFSARIASTTSVLIRTAQPVLLIGGVRADAGGSVVISF